MAYSATYNSADTSAITIDLIGTIIVALVAFGALIGLVALYRWFKKQGLGKVV